MTLVYCSCLTQMEIYLISYKRLLLWNNLGKRKAWVISKWRSYRKAMRKINVSFYLQAGRCCGRACPWQEVWDEARLKGWEPGLRDANRYLSTDRSISPHTPLEERYSEATEERENTIWSATKCPLMFLSSICQKIHMTKVWHEVQQKCACPYHLWLYKPVFYFSSTLFFQVEEENSLSGFITSRSHFTPLPHRTILVHTVLLDPFWDGVSTVFKPEHAKKP